MIRVFLVDDHAVLRQGLRLILQAVPEIQVVGEAASGQEALDRVPVVRPDVVLLDISLPDVDGLEVAQRLRDLAPDTRIIMLTVSDNRQDVVRAARAGVRGYILKSADAEEVIQAIREVVKGGAVFPPRLTALLLEAMTRPAPNQVAFTERELAVLRLIARGLGNKEIAARLSLSENTVKTHVRNILSKLNARSRAEAAAYAVRAGIVPNEDSSPS